MIDASALLWRIELLGGDAGGRWHELASAWKLHLQDGYCTFNDLHAMLAHVGARDWRAASRLEGALLRSHAQHSRYGETTRLVGLAACRAIIAFGRGYYARASELIGALPARAHGLGGSHAQRNLALPHAPRSRPATATVHTPRGSLSKEAPALQRLRFNSGNFLPRYRFW